MKIMGGPIVRWLFSLPPRRDPVKEKAREQRKLMESEHAELLAEQARLNELALTDYAEADRQAGLVGPKLREFQIRYAAILKPLLGHCLRCANESADLSHHADGRTYFRCGSCGSRGRYDLY